MKHPDDGALRRLLDHPEDAETAGHVASCAACAARRDVMAVDAAQAAILLAAPSVIGDAEAALRALHRRLATEVPPRPRLVDSLPGALRLRGRAARPAAVAALVLAAAVGLVVTGVAQSMVAIFEPQQVVAVPINPTSLTSLPDLTAYGSLTTPQRADVKRALGWADAGNQTGLHYLEPGALPSSVHGSPTYYFLQQARAAFTFSRETAAATAAARGEALPPLPANLDGATLTLQAGPGALEVVAATDGSRPQPGAGSQALLANIPQLVIVQAKAPVVTSSGPSVKDYEDALLSLPGVSPDLAAEIRAIGDPSNTLPIPIPTNMASSQAVTVNGARAVLVGDNTGIGSAVIWVRDGMVYAVAGTLTQNDIMALARSLH